MLVIALMTILHVGLVILTNLLFSPILTRPRRTRRVPNGKNLNTRFVPFAVVVTYPRGAHSDIVRTRMLAVEKVKMMRSRATTMRASANFAWH